MEFANLERNKLLRGFRKKIGLASTDYEATVEKALCERFMDYASDLLSNGYVYAEITSEEGRYSSGSEFSIYIKEEYQKSKDPIQGKIAAINIVCTENDSYGIDATITANIFKNFINCESNEITSTVIDLEKYEKCTTKTIIKDYIKYLKDDKLDSFCDQFITDTLNTISVY